jgi:hypothetical protein
VEEALAECNRRFKNLPDRHYASVETLVRQHFKQQTQTFTPKPTHFRN